ncbi:hypothetical protein [Paraburkholderia atlantica]|nr:hypothetical protein [Paraburkholderia atlantica]
MLALLGWLAGFFGAAIVTFAVVLAFRWIVYFCYLIREILKK